MKSSVIPVDGHLRSEDVRPSGVAVESSLEESSNAIPHHPLGVRPAGNQYTATSIARNLIGPFQILPDEVIAIVLEWFKSQDLLALGGTCKFFFAFTRSDDLWKTLFIESPQSKLGTFTWRGTWRSTHLDLRKDQLAIVDCGNVFSDVLHRPFLCTHTSLVPYTTNIPTSNSIARLGDLSHDEFSDKWSDKPFILTKPVREWPVYKTWDTEALLKQYKDVKFRAEAVDWTLSTYISYMNNSTDESPLYLFDRSFVEKMGLQTSTEQSNSSSPSTPSYWPPTCFGTDLFSLLGDNRPDNKWLIIGPSRSGSTYHKDPNATSAWNAVLRGSKYWIMFPSSPTLPPPPGVYVSPDSSHVTSPLSIPEWLLGFHAAARSTPGCHEGICSEGEVLHVPSGWWHLVVNLEPSIAITQNFVPRAHLVGVLAFLRDKRDQVSGFRREVEDPYGLFVERLRKEEPELLEEALRELDRMAESKKRKWDVVAGKDESEASGGFSFGFGDDSDEDIP